jgi:choline dehydrogenase-like flavoprotein
MRAVHDSLVLLFHRIWIQLSPTVSPLLGFPRVPVHGTPADGFPYQFLQFPPGEEPEIIETDVVIIGSGCGGGVAAKNLAEAGHRVIVVEQSYHFPEKHFPMTLKEGPVHLFTNGGSNVSDDGSIAVISASTWGGGGTVNWSASLQTQAYVRQEWADTGLPFFTSLEFQNCLDRVCDYMGVSTDHIKHNHGNSMILEGARKLGFAAHAVPQNTGNQKHYCGYCTMGCAAAIKQGPAVSFLADSARAGATFIEGFHVQKVLFENVAGKKIARGIRGMWTSRDANGATSGEPNVKREIIIKAKKIVASCGSLQTPLLLLRSGLTNPQIGRNLYLHPGRS